MNRREFLKLSGLFGISALVPIKFIVDNRNSETRFLQHIVETYNDEASVIQLIKEYGFASRPGQMADFLNGFVKRQPEVIAWLKRGIKFTVNPLTGKRECSNKRYEALTYGDETTRMKWRVWAEKEYLSIALMFSLPTHRPVFR